MKRTKTFFLFPIFFWNIKICLFALSALVVTFSQSLFAAETYFIPSLRVKAEYNDNKRLDVDPGNTNLDLSAEGFVAEARSELGVRDRSYRIKLNNAFSLNRYQTDLDLDSDNIFSGLQTSYDISPRSVLNFDAHYRRSNALTTELEENRTELIQANVIREDFAFRPSWTYALTEISDFKAKYSHAETSYGESELTDFSDYSTDEFSFGYTRKFSPLLSGLVNFTTVLFDVPERVIDQSLTETLMSRQESAEFTFTAGVNYKFLPTWYTELSAGARLTQTDVDNTTITTGLPSPTTTFDSLATETFDYVINFKLEKFFYKGKAAFAYSRTTRPSGTGGLRLIEVLSLGYRHYLSEKLNFSLNGSIYDSTTPNGVGNSARKNVLYLLSPSANWDIDKNLKMNIGYEYRLQERKDFDSADSNMFYVQFTYIWDKMLTNAF